MDLDFKIYEKMSNTIRFLAADMIQKASSGHPGMPMGLADVFSVFSNFYNHNPKNPHLLNRDRLVFSGGHGSAGIYALLHLWGYDVSLEDLKNFRQLNSKTPGHPERGETPGIEITTGPLGQGVANAVGFAMANQYAKHFIGHFLLHKVYCFCGDGDLEEGISYEACSLAGHLKLSNLVLIYDCNKITIDGKTDITFTENIEQRFKAQDWTVTTIDGHDFHQIDKAFRVSLDAKKPMLIIAKTTIGKGSVSLAGSPKVHGAPLGAEELRKSKEAAGWSLEEFHIPADCLARFRTALKKGEDLEKEFRDGLRSLLPEKRELLEALQNPDFSKIKMPEFKEILATRDSNSKILQAIAAQLPGFFGGSADLAASNKTLIEDGGEFPRGKNIRFGIREHSMAAITNAIAAYGLFTPFNSTFFVFSDYQKPAVRTAAMMKLKNFFIWTHDSIGVGEDGKTHQPIEQLSGFRALPDFYLFRPADANENAKAWQVALALKKTCGFVLTRQKTCLIDFAPAFGDVTHGGYLLKQSAKPKITLIASGSEVALILEASADLESRGIGTNVVSVPCFDLFCEQERSYIESVVKPGVKVLAVEAASGKEWYVFADSVLGMQSFGASAPQAELFKKFGFTKENVVAKALELIGSVKNDKI